MRFICVFIFFGIFASFDIIAQPQLEIEFAYFRAELDSAVFVENHIGDFDTTIEYSLVYTDGYCLDGEFLIAGDSSIYSIEKFSEDPTFYHAGCSCWYWVLYRSKNYLVIGCDLPTSMVMTKRLFFKRLED